MPLDNTIPLLQKGPIAPRFWSKIDIRSDNECWNWEGAHHNQGYGTIMWRGKTWFAHRVAWALTYGPIPTGLCVCHKCDNEPCCNPVHLFLATHTENIQDMVRKGRHVSHPRMGSNHPNSKVKERDVINIRERYAKGETHKDISKDFPISRRQVSDICRRKNWRHI